MELLATMGLGVAGSFAMGSVFHVLFASSNEGVQPSGFIGSVIGGILLLVAARSWKRKDAAAS
jgi:uncharacterized membrane protein YeaQ/YmgE (transglycosylase-associated protein family)